jgi:ribose-phosphate pyrophosphokinase
VASSVNLLRTRGARSVRVACVHPVMATKAFQVLDVPDLDEVIFTDTLPLVHGSFQTVPSTVLSVAPLIGDAIHRIHTGGSVGDLFR